MTPPRESDEQFRATFEQAPIGLAHLAPDGRWLRVNPRFCDLVGYTCEELLERRFQDICHAEDLEGGLEYMRQLLANEIQTYSMEMRCLPKEGPPVWINWSATLVRDHVGEPHYVLCVIEDVTEWEEAEEQVARLASYPELNPNPTIEVDPDGGVHYLNPAANRLFPDIEKVGFRHPYLEGMGPALALLASRPDIPLVREVEVAKAWYHQTLFYVRDTARVRIYGLDITGRKRTEEQVKASLQEKEVLLKEIHHRVKNNLQIVSSMLNVQARSVQDSQTLEVFRECQNRLKTMALIHERLYHSKDLARIDFDEYARKMTMDLLYSYHTNPRAVTVAVHVRDVVLSVETAIPCGLILNELVSNSLKHAFPAGRSGELRVEMRSLDSGRCELVVRDNGVGLPRDLNFRNTESLGLQLVCTLVDQLGGTIELRRKKGTEFRISFEPTPTATEPY